jgi:hypothetical protein
MKVVRNPELSLHELEGECVLHSIERKKVHVLNHSARFIWNQCATPVTPDELARRLQDEYGIDTETARTDTLKTVNTLLDRFVLTRVEE